jgi:hypothetical protein
MLETPVSVWPFRIHEKRFHVRDSAYVPELDLIAMRHCSLRHFHHRLAEALGQPESPGLCL